MVVIMADIMADTMADTMADITNIRTDCLVVAA
jgi:hypothetical protein